MKKKIWRKKSGDSLIPKRNVSFRLGAPRRSLNSLLVKNNNNLHMNNIIMKNNINSYSFPQSFSTFSQQKCNGLVHPLEPVRKPQLQKNKNGAPFNHRAFSIEKTELIQSIQNPKIKELRKALNKHSTANFPLGKNLKTPLQKEDDKTEELMVCEGIHLFEEAMKSTRNVQVVAVFLSEDKRSTLEHVVDRFTLAQRIKIERKYIVDEGVFASISSTVNSQGMITLVRPLWKSSYADIVRSKRHYVIMDSLRDPGNLGSIIRCAEAFKSSVVLLPGCVSLFNPKVIRASAGSIFRVPVVALGKDEEITTPVYTMSEKAEKIFSAKAVGRKESVGYLFGGEAGFSGVSKRLRKHTLHQFKIETEPPLDSLGVSQTVAITLQNLYQEAKTSEPSPVDLSRILPDSGLSMTF